jgi:hypothetical protein
VEKSNLSLSLSHGVCVCVLIFTYYIHLNDYIRICRLQL